MAKSENKTESYKTDRYFFADDVVFLALSKSLLQYALDIFETGCNDSARTGISVKVFVVPFNKPVQIELQVCKTTSKQVEICKYLGVKFASNDRQNKGP